MDSRVSNHRPPGVSVAEFFWSKVEKIPIVGCWLWVGSRQGGAHKGHGRFMVDGKDHYAHRYAWELQHGSIQRGMCVMHICDVDICVNPSHMRLGTISDNIFDMWDKGRGKPKGISKKRVCERGSRSIYA